MNRQKNLQASLQLGLPPATSKIATLSFLETSRFNIADSTTYMSANNVVHHVSLTTQIPSEIITKERMFLPVIKQTSLY